LRHRLDTPELNDADQGFSLAQFGRFMRNAARGAWTWLRDNF
jgi:hypothetical protein